MADAIGRLHAAIDQTIAVHAAAKAHPGPVIETASAIVDTFRGGGKLLLFGNGGSAAEAQHVACELVGRFLKVRTPLPAIALTTDTSIMTAVANDYAFDQVFVRQVAALGRRGDLAFGISTSGRSANVVRGLEAARTLGMKTVALTGSDGGAVGAAADIHINVPSDSTPRVQEAHLTLLHVICDLIEDAWTRS